MKTKYLVKERKKKTYGARDIIGNYRFLVNLSSNTIHQLKHSMTHKLFTEEKIPYDALAEFGLTREMIEDLPMYVLEDITAGNITPVLPLKVREEGAAEGVAAKSRFRLTQTDNGVEPIFFPVLEHAPIEQFTAEQQEMLKEGKAILAEVIKDDDEVTSFVQIDADTNQVMSVPSPVIGRNLQVLANKLSLGSAEVKVIQDGDALTFFIDDQPVTVGIDLLNSGSGIRIEDGDAQQWKQNAKREWDKYTFGVYGCWIADEKGDLSYTPEEQYDEELWNELARRRNGIQNTPKIH